MQNPDPDHITDEMWMLWERRPNKAWRLGGIYANKKGYHNTVTANQIRWPKNYSVILMLDLKGPVSKARAIDYTMTDEEMKLATRRMRESALDPNDDRLACVREFYGTLDGTDVYGLIKTDLDGPWESSTADDTHLWHMHIGIFGEFVDNWPMLAGIISVLSGEKYTDWKKNEMLVKFGDSGEDVKYWQSLYNSVREITDKKLPEIKVDGDYGQATANAFTAFVRVGGGQDSYLGQSTPPWFVLRLQQAFILKTTMATLPTFPEAMIKDLVNEWLTENFPANLNITGTVVGKVEI